MNYVLHDVLSLDEEKAQKLSKLIDKKDKLREDQFKDIAWEIVGDKSDTLFTLLNSKNFEEFTIRLPQTKEEHKGLKEVKEVMDALEKLGVTNVRFDQTLMRGFDYYTGIVFEVFDTNQDNRRSVFGGGRYDELLSIFGNEKVPAVGFGAGDVIAKDILETYNLLPEDTKRVKVYICPTEHSYIPLSNDIAQELRSQNIKVAIDYTDKKVGDKIKNADKNKAEFVLCIGHDEAENGAFKLKNLSTREEISASRVDLAKFLV